MMSDHNAIYAKFFTLILLFNACSTSCRQGETVIGVTSNETDCTIYGRYDSDIFSSKCLSMKRGLPVTDQAPKESAQWFQTFLNQQQITFIDIFTSKDGATVGIGTLNDRFGTTIKCFQFDGDKKVTINTCETFGLSTPIKENLTGVEKIHDLDYTIFSYRIQNDNDHFIIVDERTKISEKSIIKDDIPTPFNAITYLGLSRRGNHMIGALTPTDVTVVYELTGMTLTNVIDKRLSHSFLGCNRICLEGDVDSMYKLTGDAIYFTRMTSLDKIINFGKETTYIETVASAVEYDCDTAFVIWTNDQTPIVFYVRETADEVVSVYPKKRFTKSQFFSHIPKNEKIFASIQYSKYDYYFFVGDQIFEYKYRNSNSNSTSLEYIISYPIKYRFARLWKKFDAAFKDGKYVYFFNQDYNVRYEWKEKDVMIPIYEGPRLNQKTFWQCRPNVLNNLIMDSFQLNGLESYFDAIVKRYRYIPLEEKDDDTAMTTASKVAPPTVRSQPRVASKSTPKWLLPVIICCVIVAIALVIALFVICIYI